MPFFGMENAWAMDFIEFKTKVEEHATGRMTDAAFIDLCHRVITVDAVGDDWYRAVVHVDLGQAHLARNELDQAREAFSSCIREMPGESVCYFGMSLYHTTMHNTQEAVRYALLAADHNPDPAAAETIRHHAADLPRIINAMPLPDKTD